MFAVESHIQEIERASKQLSLRRIILMLIRGDVVEFKNLLKEVENATDSNVEDLCSDLDSLDFNEIEKLYSKYKKFSSFYDGMNHKYSTENYFNDPEVKNLLRQITKNLHKLEFTCYRHLNHDSHITSTPEYIKSGISQISMKTIGENLDKKK